MTSPRQLETGPNTPHQGAAHAGEAVGIVRDFGLRDKPPVTDDGPTLQRILMLLAKAGFRLRLLTAPYYR